MSATKKSKSKSAASERGQAARVAEVPAPLLRDGAQWREQAAFHLTLDRAPDAQDVTAWRTHVYHEETGEEQTQTGILQQDLILWMRDRAGAPLAQEPVAHDQQQPAQAARGAAAETSAAEPRLRVDDLEIEAIEAAQPAGATAPKRLRARVRFAHSQVPSNAAGPSITHGTIHVLAYARDSDQAIVLGVSRRPIVASEPSCTEMLECDLPPLGEYQTIANVVLDEDLVGAALGPLLRVVP
jgi:hypothetical protein